MTAHMTEPLTVSRFCKAFVASLILLDQVVILPKSLGDRSGFRHLAAYLDTKAKEEKEKGPIDRDWYKQILRLRNYLQSSNNGSFDNFETALRDLQTSSVSYPNPDYEEIDLEIPSAHAKFILSELHNREREIIENATKAYLDGKENSNAY